MHVRHGDQYCIVHGVCRKVAKFSENYLRSLASTTLESLEKTVNIQEEKFSHFEVYMSGTLSSSNYSLNVLNHLQERLSVFLSQTIKSANSKLKLRRADVIRHVVSAKEQWRKVRSR